MIVCFDLKNFEYPCTNTMFSFIVVEKKQNTNKKTKQVLLVTGGWHGSRIRIYDISNIKDSKLYQAHQIAIEYSLSDTEYREYWNHGCIVLSDKLCMKQLDCSMTAPRKYVCHRCNLQGHWMKECPTIGDPNFDKNDDTDGDGNGDGKDKKNMNDISYCWREIKFLLFGGFHNKPFDQSFVIVTSYFRARKEKRSAKGLSKKSLQIKTKFDKIIPRFCSKSKDITKYYGFSMQQINNKHYLLFGGSVSNESANNCYSDCIFSLKINDDDIIENQSHKSQTRITFEQLNWVKFMI